MWFRSYLNGLVVFLIFFNLVNSNWEEKEDKGRIKAWWWPAPCLIPLPLTLTWDPTSSWASLQPTGGSQNITMKLETRFWIQTAWVWIPALSLTNMHFRQCLDSEAAVNISCHYYYCFSQTLQYLSADGGILNNVISFSPWKVPTFVPLQRGLQGGGVCKGSICQCRRCQRHEFNPWVRKIPWNRKW